MRETTPVDSQKTRWVTSGIENCGCRSGAKYGHPCSGPDRPAPPTLSCDQLVEGPDMYIDAADRKGTLTDGCMGVMKDDVAPCVNPLCTVADSDTP